MSIKILKYLSVKEIIKSVQKDLYRDVHHGEMNNNGTLEQPNYKDCLENTMLPLKFTLFKNFFLIFGDRVSLSCSGWNAVA